MPAAGAAGVCTVERPKDHEELELLRADFETFLGVHTRRPECGDLSHVHVYKSSLRRVSTDTDTELMI